MQLNLTQAVRKAGTAQRYEGINGLVLHKSFMLLLGESQATLKMYLSADIFYDKVQNVVVVKPFVGPEGSQKIHSKGREIVISSIVGQQMPTGVYQYVAEHEQGFAFKLSELKSFKS